MRTHRCSSRFNPRSSCFLCILMSFHLLALELICVCRWCNSETAAKQALPRLNHSPFHLNASKTACIFYQIKWKNKNQDVLSQMFRYQLLNFKSQIKKKKIFNIVKFNIDNLNIYEICSYSLSYIYFVLHIILVLFCSAEFQWVKTFTLYIIDALKTHITSLVHLSNTWICIFN